MFTATHGATTAAPALSRQVRGQQCGVGLKGTAECGPHDGAHGATPRQCQQASWPGALLNATQGGRQAGGSHHPHRSAKPAATLPHLRGRSVPAMRTAASWLGAACRPAGTRPCPYNASRPAGPRTLAVTGAGAPNESIWTARTSPNASAKETDSAHIWPSTFARSMPRQSVSRTSTSSRGEAPKRVTSDAQEDATNASQHIAAGHRGDGVEGRGPASPSPGPQRAARRPADIARGRRREREADDGGPRPRAPTPRRAPAMLPRSRQPPQSQRARTRRLMQPISHDPRAGGIPQTMR